MAGSTVTVACKLPNGLHMVIKGRGRVTLKGFAHPVDKAPTVPIIGGYALTHGVDEEFFTEWLKQHQELDAVKAGLVFAAARNDAVIGRAKEQAEIESGLEPRNPDKPGEGVERVGV